MSREVPPSQPEFRFGVATADHQCEAYNGQDDIRDVWEREHHLTPRGKATDFWNRYCEDVDLARGLGCRAFRLSLSWARLEPSPGVWDPQAFDHYRDVLQYMRDSGMATVVTLHHNTWPLHVQAAGDGAGLLDSDFPQRLAAYAAIVAERLGDLIDYYVTINEPNQLVYGFVKLWCMRNYAMPPGLDAAATPTQQMEAVQKLIPNLFLAHGRARAAIHKARPGARVGSNPLVLGLPRWLQRLVDRTATHLRRPSDLLRQGKHISQTMILDSGRVDISIAQLAITQLRADRVLFSLPYFTVEPSATSGRVEKFAVAVALGSHALLNVVNAAVRGSEQADVSTFDRDPLSVDRSVDAIRKRGVLRVGIHPGVAGMCEPAQGGGFEGIEPNLARQIARRIFGDDKGRVAFICLNGDERISATRSSWQYFDGLRKTISMFATILGTNWWNLGMAGRLAPFLCPKECVGTLDYVGIDYYWGVPSLRPSQLQRLLSAAECRYANAPVWPSILYEILREQQREFPGKPIVVIENGCVTSADDVTRADYIASHVENVRRALAEGVPIDAYLCWSITSNREWGLPFDQDSDFGLYHIDLDTDPNLTRTATAASARYAQIIKTF